MRGLWRKIRQVGRVAEPAPSPPAGGRVGAGGGVGRLGADPPCRCRFVQRLRGGDRVGVRSGLRRRAVRGPAGRLAAARRRVAGDRAGDPEHGNEPLRRTYEAVPAPKVVVAVGDCARNCGVFAGAYGVAGAVADVVPVDLEVPGCPPRPEAIVEALRTLTGR